MDCHSLHERMMEEWGQDLMAPLKGRRFPIGGMIDLNERCNLACVHCYINQPLANTTFRKNELNTGQIKQIIDQIADAGCLFLTMTGGEPLVRKDFSELYLHARQKGILVTLFTNATLVTPHVADLLSSTTPQLVEITLYGATQETYEAVTGVRGSFMRCMKGIRLLRDREIKVSLKAVILTLNRHELPAMRALAKQLGVDFRYDGTIWPRLNGEENPFRYRLSVDQMLALDQEDPKRLEQWQTRSKAFHDVTIRNEYVFSCGAGINTFHIDSRGCLCACIMLRSPAYDLAAMSFDEAWQRLGNLRTLTRTQHTACETCRVGALCGQCAGWSKVVHGDYETPVDFICQLGKSRAGQIKLN